MSTIKGSFGYLKKQRKKAAWITVLLFLMSAIVFVLGIYTRGVQLSGLTASEALRQDPLTIFRLGDKKNWLTIVSAIGVLPAARYLVNLVLLFKAVKTSCPEALHERCETERGNVTVLYDLYLTGYQTSYPLYCAYAGHKELLGLLAEGRSDSEEAEKHIREMLAKDGQKGVTVKIFTEEDKFLTRLKGEASRSASDDDDAENGLTESLRLLTQISL